MSTATLVSVEEYLSATYRPDCDFVDGVLIERNVGIPADQLGNVNGFHSVTLSLVVIDRPLQTFEPQHCERLAKAWIDTCCWRLR